MNKDKLTIGISACLLGENCRYDGSDAKSQAIVDTVSDRFVVRPVCPEVSIGLPTPRPPIALFGSKALDYDNRRLDHTEELIDCADKFLGNSEVLGGFIFKSKSPSCGLSDAKVFNSDNKVIGTGAGIFSGEIMKLRPKLPVIDEILFENKELMNEWLEKVDG